MADFYPLRNIKFKNLFPSYNQYQKKVKNAKKKVVVQQGKKDKHSKYLEMLTLPDYTKELVER